MRRVLCALAAVAAMGVWTGAADGSNELSFEVAGSPTDFGEIILHLQTPAPGCSGGVVAFHFLAYAPGMTATELAEQIAVAFDDQLPDQYSVVFGKKQQQPIHTAHVIISGPSVDFDLCVIGQSGEVEIVGDDPGDGELSENGITLLAWRAAPALGQAGVTVVAACMIAVGAVVLLRRRRALAEVIE